MSTDWQEKEREFLTSLKADTGRDLAEWMRVIAAQNLPHRNDIIDWLRQQGFMFARASWLERIHHNGGRPIYLDPAALNAEVQGEDMVARRVAGGGTVFTPSGPTSRSQPEPPSTPVRQHPPKPRIAADSPTPQEPTTVAAEMTPAPVAETVQQQVKSEATTPVKADTSPLVPPASTPSAEREEVLAKAKAYRPLAVHLLRLVERAVPAVSITTGPAHLLLWTANAGGGPFGLIAVSGKDIRLVLRLGPEVASAPLGPVKLPVTLSRAAQGMTHMTVLTDARQLDDHLLTLVSVAAGI